MKKISLSNTKSLYLSGIICSLFCGIFLSCSEDNTDKLESSKGILFIPSIQESWLQSGRSATSQTTNNNHVSILYKEGQKALYLHTIYSDRNNANPFSLQNDKTQTRNTPVTGSNMYASFGVSAFCYTDQWNENKTPNYIYDATVLKTGNAYALPSMYYWPGASYKLRFFAYAPQRDAAYTLSGAGTPGSPTIHALIPASVNDQKDLLVASTDEYSGNSAAAVPLAFKHPLTAIRFACGENVSAGKLVKVSLKNVYTEGTYNMGTEQWTLTNATGSFEQLLNKSITGTNNEEITTSSQTFMMLPQTLPANAQIEIVFEDQSGQTTLTSSIGGKTWPMGKTVTYKISMDDKIIIETNLGNFTDGGEI